MLDTISDLISGIVEFVSRGVFAVARVLFRWEASAERPGWVRVVAIGIILVACASLLTLLVSLFVTALYVLAFIAAVGAAIAFFTSG
jgi:Na+/melibiose symporter-like transporter